MARTPITVTETLRAGVTQPAQQTTDNTENMLLASNDGKTIIEIEGVGGACTLSFIKNPNTLDGDEVKNKEVACAEGVKKVIGPFPPGIYNQAGGEMLVNCSSNKGKLRVYRLVG